MTTSSDPGQVAVNVPTVLAQAIADMAATFLERGQAYGHIDEVTGVFAVPAAYLGVPKHRVSDTFELTKLSRIRQMVSAGVSDGALLDSYRDKAVYALIAYAQYLEATRPAPSTLDQARAAMQATGSVAPDAPEAASSTLPGESTDF